MESNQNQQPGSNNLPRAGGIGSLTAPPQRAPRPGPQRAPFGGVGGSNAGSPPLSQVTIIKSVQQMLPKIQGDTDRQNVREQVVDSLIRETSMSRERMQEINKMIQEHVSEQQQQSKQSANNDECSSGGTTPTLNRQPDNLENQISQILKLTIWLEESVFEKCNDSKAANYKTLVRRLTQALRSKEEQKHALLMCNDLQSVNDFVQEFISQRGGASAAQANMKLASAGGGSGGAQEAASSSSGSQQFGTLGNPFGMGGNASQAHHQEQSAQVSSSAPPTASNPFAAQGRGMGMTRGTPRGGQRGGMARGGPRFAAPIPGRFTAPASSGAQRFPAPPMPATSVPPAGSQPANQPSTSNEASQEERKEPSNEFPLFPTSSGQMPAPQKQMIESGTADNSSLLLTPSSPKNPDSGVGTTAPARQGDHSGAEPAQSDSLCKPQHQEKDAGGGQFSLDFIDQLGNGSGSIASAPLAGGNQLAGPGGQQPPEMDFLQEFLNPNRQKKEERNEPEQQLQEQSSNMQHPRSNENSQGDEGIPRNPLQENIEELGRRQEPEYAKWVGEDQKELINAEVTVQVGANGDDQGGEQRPDVDRTRPNQNLADFGNEQQPQMQEMLNNMDEDGHNNLMQCYQAAQNTGQHLAPQPQSNHQISSNTDGLVSVEGFRGQSHREQNVYQQEQSSLGAGRQFQDGCAPIGAPNEGSQLNREQTQHEVLFQEHIQPFPNALEEANENGPACLLNEAIQQERSANYAFTGETGAEASKQPHPEPATSNQGDNGYQKASSGRTSSKPQSGRMTPPSGYSGKRSSRRVTATNATAERFDLGHISTSQSNKDETGSVQMSNDPNTNDKFASFAGFKEPTFKDPNVRNGSVLIASDDRRSMDRGASGSDTYRQDALQRALRSEVNPKEFQSEYKAQINAPCSPGHRDGTRQVEGFIQSRQINMPPESVASLASIPVTSFEDTQQMLRAYKKKKRELTKMKEKVFKMETDFTIITQRNTMLEEELALTQKRMIKSEKSLKQAQLREQQKDSALTEKQLSLKTKEAEVFQKELGKQKQENQQLREKVRDLLKKYSNQPSSQGGPIGQPTELAGASGLSKAELDMMKQQNDLELQKQKTEFEVKNRQISEEANYYKQKYKTIEQEMQLKLDTITQQKREETQRRELYERSLQELQQNNATQNIESVNQYIKENNEMKIQLQEHTIVKNTLQAQVDELQKMVATEKQMKMDQSNQLEIIQSQLQQTNSRAENLQRENEALKLQVQQLTNQGVAPDPNMVAIQARLQSSVQELTADKLGLQKIIEEGNRAEKANVQKQLEGAYSEIKSLKNNVLEMQNQRTKMEFENYELKQTIKNNEGLSMSEQRPTSAVSSNSWQQLGDTSQNASQQSSKYPTNQSTNHVANEQSMQPAKPPPNIGMSQQISMQNHPKGIMIESQYMDTYNTSNQIDEYQPNKGAVNNQSNNALLKPRDIDIYDFTLDDLGSASQPVPVANTHYDQPASNLFNDSNVPQVINQTAQNLFSSQDEANPIQSQMQAPPQREQVPQYAGMDKPQENLPYQQNMNIRDQTNNAAGVANTGVIQQPGTSNINNDLNSKNYVENEQAFESQQVNQPEQQQQQTFAYSNDAYDFFNDDNDNDGQAATQTGGDVIPNSMFD